MNRSKKIIVICHCLLNANAKIYPLASCSGVYQDVLKKYIEGGYGIVQLPCPETGYLGLNRWGMSREQYDHPHFREYCRKILKPTLYQLKAFVDAGYEISGVIGMNGSPNCGVTQTCIGFTGGEICAQTDIKKQQQNLSFTSGKGVFFRILEKMLTDEQILLNFEAIDEKQAN